MIVAATVVAAVKLRDDLSRDSDGDVTVYNMDDGRELNADQLRLLLTDE